jgi:hypothetical protein
VYVPKIGLENMEFVTRELVAKLKDLLTAVQISTVDVDESLLEYLVEGISTKSLSFEEQFEIFFGIFPDVLQRSDVDHVELLPYIRKGLFEGNNNKNAEKKKGKQAPVSGGSAGSENAVDTKAGKGATDKDSKVPVAPAVNKDKPNSGNSGGTLSSNNSSMKSNQVSSYSSSSSSSRVASTPSPVLTTPEPASALQWSIKQLLVAHCGEAAVDNDGLVDAVVLDYLTESLPELTDEDEAVELLQSYFPTLSESPKAVSVELLNIIRDSARKQRELLQQQRQQQKQTQPSPALSEQTEATEEDTESGGDDSEEVVVLLDSNETQLKEVYPSISREIISFVYRRKCARNVTQTAVELGMVCGATSEWQFGSVSLCVRQL